MLKIVKQHGFIFEDIEQAEMCRDLYAELSNHTRRPSNGGYTPHELMQKKMRESGKPESGFLGGFPQSMSFGSGIVNSIQNGTLDGNELKKMIIGHEQFPMELKANLLKEVDKAMKGVGKNDKSEKASNQAADRNAPCPCGSGKKYKHCCGKLN